MDDRLLLLCFFIPLWTSSFSASKFCFECNGSQSAACRTFRWCGDDEMCYTQRYMDRGSFYFRSGCEKKTYCDAMKSKRSRLPTPQPVVCESCCDTSRCNAYKCNTRSPIDNRGRICYNCLSSSDPSQCKTANYCGYGGQCLMFSYHKIESNSTMYAQRCSTSTECQALQSAMTEAHKSGDTWHKVTCCDTDLCNDGAPAKASHSAPFLG